MWGENLANQLTAQTVKNGPTRHETWVWSLGGADPLEEGMAAHSSILAWRMPCTEEPGGLQSMGSQRVEHDWVTNTFNFNTIKFSLHNSQVANQT